MNNEILKYYSSTTQVLLKYYSSTTLLTDNDTLVYTQQDGANE